MYSLSGLSDIDLLLSGLATCVLLAEKPFLDGPEFFRAALQPIVELTQVTPRCITERPGANIAGMAGQPALFQGPSNNDEVRHRFSAQLQQKSRREQKGCLPPGGLIALPVRMARRDVLDHLLVRDLPESPSRLVFCLRRATWTGSLFIG